MSWSLVDYVAHPTGIGTSFHFSAASISDAGGQAGDLIVYFVAYRGSKAWASSNMTIITQQAGDLSDLAGAVLAMATWDGTSSHSLSMTGSGTSDGGGGGMGIYRWSGAGSFDLDGSSKNQLSASSVDATTGAITAARAGALVVAMVAAAGGSTGPLPASPGYRAATSPSTASGTTVSENLVTGTWDLLTTLGSNVGSGIRYSIANAVKSATGSTGTIQATFDTSKKHTMLAAVISISPALLAESRAFTIAGAPASFSHGRRMAAASGTMAMTGTAASFGLRVSIDAEPGSITLAGTDATFTVGLSMSADPGSYALEGSDAATFDFLGIQAGEGVYVSNWSDVALSFSRAIAAEGVAFSLVGEDVELTAVIREFTAGTTPKERTIAVGGQRARRVEA